MALNYGNSFGIIKRSRTFNSVEREPDREGNWLFEYTTLNTDKKDIVDYEDENPNLLDPSEYSEETIFFNSPSDGFDISTTVNDIYIDNSPIVLPYKPVIMSTAITTGHKCKIIVNSNTPIDFKNIVICCGENNNWTFYSSLRKNNSIIDPGYVKDMSIYKDGNTYTLTFTIDDKQFGDNADEIYDRLNEYQLCVKLWNIAGTQLIYTTPDTTVWKRLSNTDDITTFNRLVITFSDWSPDSTKQLTAHQEGKVKVTIYNPNEDLASIVPKYEMAYGSIGQIDETTVSYDEATGIMTFIVKNITMDDGDKNEVIINAWLAVDVPEIDGVLKDITNVTGIDIWPYAINGRQIKLMQNVPGYYKDTKYNSFVQNTQNFLNTMYTSLSDNKHIGVLEKMLRIGNFNNVKKLETELLDNYKNEYNITIDPNMDTLKTFLETKGVETKDNKTAAYTTYLMDNEDLEIDDEVMEKTTKKFLFDELTGDELYCFIKDVYKNIPYYNQMAGTYRGITFILDQLGLCCKLVELWADKNIRTNFDHDEQYYREDDIDAVRKLIPDDTLASIGNLYLTSRFDIDVLESDLSFEEFNAMAYNIVKIVLAVKPIHRVLRNLTYLFTIKCNIHFQYFLLDNLNTGYGYYDQDTKTVVEKMTAFTYIWNLYDSYSKEKTKSTVINDIPYVSSIYVPFNSVYADRTFDPTLLNKFGEYRIDPITKDNRKFPGNEGSKAYKAGEYKPYDPDVTKLETAIPAVKNTYHTLNNFAMKVEKSRLKELRMNFIYMWEDEEHGVHFNTDNASFKNGIKENDKIITVDYDNLTLTVELITAGKTITIPLCNWLVGRYTYSFMPKVTKTWKRYDMSIPNDITFTSDRNGFYINLHGFANKFQEGLGVKPNDPQGKALLLRIDNLLIPLGTNYITQGLPIEITETNYTLISERSNDKEKPIRLLSVDGDQTDPDKYPDYLVDELSL